MTSRPQNGIGQGIDPLTGALDFLRLSETAYYHAEFRAPWSFVAPKDCPKFHFMAAGRCWLEVDGSDPRWLEPGDFIVIPRGRGHRIASTPAARPLEIVNYLTAETGRRFAYLRKGGSGGPAVILCGDIDFKHPAAAHLVALLPAILFIPRTSAVGEWLGPILSLLAREALEMKPGGEAVITRLTDVLVIQAIRLWLDGNPLGQSAWLAAVRDPNVGRALSVIHRQPEARWTVASLAKASALSRSAFAARFTALMNEPAMRYLTRWRMHLARELLLDGSKGIEAIADALGYESAASFSRAFRRSEGIWPGAVRRETRVESPEPVHRYLRTGHSRGRVEAA